MENVSKNFLTISKQECLIVYKDVLENSDTRWNIVNKLAKLGDYGGATSCTIISIEELVKALIIYFDGRGFYFRKVKGMKIFFRNHQIRYVIAYVIFVMNVFAQKLKKFILKIRDDPEYILRLSKEIKHENFLEKKLKIPLLRKLSELRKEFEWFSDIDISRQNGFYIDYSNVLKTPLNITSQDYIKLKTKLAKVRNVGNGIIQVFEENSPETALQLANLLNDFRKKEYYNFIEKA